MAHHQPERTGISRRRLHRNHRAHLWLANVIVVVDAIALNRSVESLLHMPTLFSLVILKENENGAQKPELFSCYPSGYSC